MQLLSVNTGLPREVHVNGRTVRTSIWKSPIEGRVRVTTLNIDGDEQSDLTVHGGPFKAVYCYPSEHYAYWRDELPGVDLPRGVFGENLTTEGLLETDVCIGDRFRAGTAEFLVTQPRQPCFKLGIRFGREDMLRRFLAERPTGLLRRGRSRGRDCRGRSGGVHGPRAQQHDRQRHRGPSAGRRREGRRSEARRGPRAPVRRLERPLPETAGGEIIQSAVGSPPSREALRRGRSGARLWRIRSGVPSIASRSSIGSSGSRRARGRSGARSTRRAW